MSDNLLTTRLSRLTPDAGGLDRDALLFSAGKASARPNRPWIALAGVLAASQALTLVLTWWQKESGPALAPMDRLPIAKSEPDRPPVPEPSASWSQRERIVASEGKLPPPLPIDLGPAREPLRAFGPPPVDLLN